MTDQQLLRSLLVRVRRRWRTRVVLRGSAIVLGSAIVILVVASYALGRSSHGPAATLVVRVLAWIALAALAARWIVLPLVRRVSDAQLALYLEEQEPSLDAALVSAVEEVSGGTRAPVPDRSAAMARRLVESALQRARAVEARDPERRRLQRSAAMLATVAAAGLALVLLGPPALRQAARLIAWPWGAAEAAEVYAVLVEPGNARLARGGDQEIRARLRGFAAADAELAVRRGVAGGWERLPMGAGSDSGAFIARLFDVDAPTQYFVEANGVRSPVFTLEVTDLPAVRRVDLEYRYPAYTGLAPQRVDDGGDIAALEGTVVRVRVTPTVATRAGRIVVDGAAPAAMTADSAGALTGELRVSKPGSYRIELQAADGSMVRASLDYAIDVLDDAAPTVTFKTPGRDLKVTSLEEVFTDVVASDDYGVQSLSLVYSVNGGAERVVPLGGGPRRELSAGYTFYLEEQSLKPGDVVSYFARARDVGLPGRGHTTATDIYFMEVRPFEREYRQSEQRGAPGGGQGEEESPSALSQRQREIVAATYKVVRDSAGQTASERRDNLSTITLSQGTLRDRVETLARRLAQRGVAASDSTMRVIAEELPLAAAAMRDAEERLGRRAPADALPPEQRALQHLQRAEAAYREVQVSFGGGQGGGGGGANADDLSELFELDVDRTRNQYESVDRGGQGEAAERKVDETLERLRALAARQQQENERALRRADAMRQSGGGGSSGGASQRRLAEEAQELGRQLERLARERQSTELAESARRLQDAASAMRRSAAAGREGGAAEGASALDRLQEARRLLDRERGGRLDRDADQARRAAEELAARQRQIGEDVARMRGAGGSDPAVVRQLTERKDALARDVDQLEGQLDRLSREARGDQPDAARKLQGAASEMRERRISDKVRYSRGVMRAGSPEYARAFEEQIGSDLDETRQRVADAVGAIGQPARRKGSEALGRARDLVRGLESLRDRAQGQQGQQGGQPRGSQGQQGQPGQAQGGEQQGAQPGQQMGGRTQGGRFQPGGSGQGMAFGALTPEQVRQYAREYRERRESAEALGRDLRREGIDAESLDALLRQLRALESRRAYDDPEELARLQASVVDGFKSLEFALRRRLADDPGDGPVARGSQDVPPQFRALVEEYYRALGRKP